MFPVGVVEELRMESRLQSLVSTPEYISSDRKSLKTMKQRKKQKHLGSSLRAQLSRSIEFWVDGIGSKRAQELTQERPEHFISPNIRASRNIVVRQVIIG